MISQVNANSTSVLFNFAVPIIGSDVGETGDPNLAGFIQV